MTDTWKRVAWTFAQAFAAAFIVLSPGIWKAPNMQAAKAAAVSAVLAGLAAGFSAAKNLVLKPDSKVR